METEKDYAWLKRKIMENYVGYEVIFPVFGIRHNDEVDVNLPSLTIAITNGWKRIGFYLETVQLAGGGCNIPYYCLNKLPKDRKEKAVQQMLQIIGETI